MSTLADTPVAILTPAQCRAARALLGWSQQELARKASVATSTVADFERGHRSPVANNLEALKTALEAGGIRLLPRGAVAAPHFTVPLRTRVPQERVTPVRWITENDLENWANSRFGQSTFPELIRRLVLAESGYHPRLRFPSGDSVGMQGWDGETYVDVVSPIIPRGLTGWELGTDKQVKKKADDDYHHRSENPLHLNQKTTTFVFATPRRWAKKSEWLKEKNAERVWLEVRALDAVDIVQWLERFPAVSLWFARAIGKLPNDVRTLEDVWREWSLSTSPPLSDQLVLADRDDTATKLRGWLRDEAATFGIHADAPIEAIAFLYAAIEQYPTGYRDFYHSRAIVAANADAARAIADVGTPLIIILEGAEPGLSNTLVHKGHHVFLAQTISDDDAGQTLKRPIRYTIQDELIQMGLTPKQAQNLAEELRAQPYGSKTTGSFCAGYKVARMGYPGQSKDDDSRAFGWRVGQLSAC